MRVCRHPASLVQTRRYECRMSLKVIHEASQYAVGSGGVTDSKSHLEFDAALTKRVSHYRHTVSAPCNFSSRLKGLKPCLHCICAADTVGQCSRHMTRLCVIDRRATVRSPEIGLSRCGNRLPTD